ncbi:hypothetical protein A3G14_04305 [Candidatus Curtissbacteria bacterium RIFCSPLOWO2_12_FULL_38_9]|uniref:Glycosyl transferase family 1 n=1 Tax=Candidatus Curtissbacteria bacterium RIFCSPLOWO2_12_FULL_38_9 TaxID=1797735 RepID=A0A1F5ID14_9BACT|nr:MAG: hypothetical protein A3G14_04305 [Candidatus Curtissbacteria bacterium RIFCSPLOWO2_12_FULL_38_9]
MSERRKANPENLKVGLFSAYAMDGVNGGVQENIYETRSFLESLGHEVYVFSPQNGPPEESKRLIHFGTAKPHEHDGSIAYTHTWPPVMPKTIRNLIKSHNLDIANYHEPEVSLPTLELILAAPWLNVVTFHVHNEPKKRYLLYKLITPIFGRKIDARVVISEAVSEAANRYFPGKYYVIPNGVDTQKFNPLNEKVAEFADDKVNIIFVGRLEERKGVQHLLRAYAHIPKKHGNTRLIVVGDGQMAGDLKAQATYSGLQNVHFEGKVSDEDLPKYYATAHIFASLATHGESQGVVNLEAMASGLPIIAGDNPGYRTTVTPETGYLLDPKNTQEVAQALKTLIDDRNLRNTMGEAGRKNAKNYDWSQIGGKVLDLFLETLEEKGRL